MVNWPRRAVRVRVPATSANLGPGFDALGLALVLYDEVTAEITDSGLTIEVSGEGEAAANAGESHLVVRAMRAAFAAAVGEQPPGLALSCVNAIPQGRGLGSSAGAVVAGLLAGRALAGFALSGDDAAEPDEPAAIAGAVDQVAVAPGLGGPRSGPDVQEVDVAGGAARLGDEDLLAMAGDSGAVDQVALGPGLDGPRSGPGVQEVDVAGGAARLGDEDLLAMAGDLGAVDQVAVAPGLGGPPPGSGAGAVDVGVAGGGGWLVDEGLLAMAAELEGHPDNAAACLAGGLTVAWTSEAGDGSPGDSGVGEQSSGAVFRGAGTVRPGPEMGGGRAAGPRPRAVRLEPDPAIVPVVCVPANSLATEQARRALPEMVPHADAAKNAVRSALLVAALTQHPDLLFDATHDLLHEPYRAPLMPASADLIGRLRKAGIPAVLSGAGPTVLAFIVNRRTPGSPEVDSIAIQTGNEWHVSPLDVDRQGATIQSVPPGIRLRADG